MPSAAAECWPFAIGAAPGAANGRSSGSLGEEPVLNLSSRAFCKYTLRTPRAPATLWNCSPSLGSADAKASAISEQRDRLKLHTFVHESRVVGDVAETALAAVGAALGGVRVVARFAAAQQMVRRAPRPESLAPQSSGQDLGDLRQLALGKASLCHRPWTRRIVLADASEGSLAAMCRVGFARRQRRTIMRARQILYRALTPGLLPPGVPVRGRVFVQTAPDDMHARHGPAVANAGLETVCGTCAHAIDPT
eukprot:CAMPEP_0170234454 /NCGR_PEP_ID=MMETSP0116_2-20130129/16974_1 /TAXON_ID=400756 /ORGANISM="Durinskia baltica, Strain CSIRO CS-38" /LENGTH=250 /DNA_ID=CAMNT_0010485251 /DNA_START=307 /DNA_END=1055 /DNA_ORIENTATION=+